MNAGAGDVLDLIVTDGEPAGTRTDQEAVNADGVYQWHQGGVAESADEAAFEIVNLQANELGEVEEILIAKSGYRVLSGQSLRHSQVGAGRAAAPS
jgi:hypothetical protein